MSREAKAIVRVALSARELALVDMWREGHKVRVGIRPCRAAAITAMISELGRDAEVAELQGYANLLATLGDYGERLKALEAAQPDGNP